MVLVFLYLSYLVVLFQIVADLFRDHRLSGWRKALWILLLIILPVVAALVYLVVRGRGMALRQQVRAEAGANSTEDHLRTLAGAPDPAKQSSDAKALLDPGTISDQEFAVLKTKALA